MSSTLWAVGEIPSSPSCPLLFLHPCISSNLPHHTRGSSPQGPRLDGAESRLDIKQTVGRIFHQSQTCFWMIVSQLHTHHYFNNFSLCLVYGVNYLILSQSVVVWSYWKVFMITHCLCCGHVSSATWNTLAPCAILPFDLWLSAYFHLCPSVLY